MSKTQHTNTERPKLSPREILRLLKERQKDALPPPQMTPAQIEETRQWQERLAGSKRDHAAVLAGEETEEHVSFDRRRSILQEQFETLMMQVECSRDCIIFAEALLANPELRGAGSPEDLDRMIAKEAAHIEDVRVEILRITGLIVDTLAGKFGDRTPNEEAERWADRQRCDD